MAPRTPRPPPPTIPLWTRCRRLGLLALVVSGLWVGLLTACQGRLIYPAPRYPAGALDALPPGIMALPYTTDEGQQRAFLVTRRRPEDLHRWWLAFGGNGMTALGWADLLRGALPDDAGLLLIEYPGYGANEGSCTPGRILASTEAAVTALAARLGRTPEDLRVVGHSLGAAAALQYAAAHPVRRVVLCAPFTSMVDMGHRILCWPLGQLVWHRFDNRDRLDEVLARPDAPPVLILHGEADRLIPVTMGQALADAHPGQVRLVRIPDADHQTILDDLPEALRQADR